MNIEFTIKDFEGVGFYDRKTAMEQANKRLAEMLSSATVVYGTNPDDISWTTKQWRNTDTHKALLINIEELPKLPCKHEPMFEFGGVQNLTSNKCKHCDETIVAEWRVKE